MSARIAIGIAGAGIGGLAAAALLARAGHDVTILDQFEAPGPVGSGLILQPTGLAVLDRTGCGARIRGLGAPLARVLGHEATTGRLVLDVVFDPSGQRLGLGIHRAALWQALADAAHAAGARLVPSARVIAAPETAARRHLHSADGRSFGPFDLVVDAAGARSPLSPLKARDLAFGAIWASLPWDAAGALPYDRLSQRYDRARRMAGIMPIGRLAPAAAPLTAVFWSIRRDQLPAWQDAPFSHWQDEARGLWPALDPFISRLSEHAQMIPAFYAHGTLRRRIAPRLFHLGDAAQRTSPQLGQGANMALLDALALTLALEVAEGHQALVLAARMRRGHVWLYQALSATFTPQYQSDSRILPIIRDLILMPLSQLPPLPRILSRLLRGELIPPLAGHDLSHLAPPNASFAR